MSSTRSGSRAAAGGSKARPRKKASPKPAVPGSARGKTARPAARPAARGVARGVAAGVAALDAPVPDFSLPGTGGASVRLQALRGGKVVLYFYPKDNTPGCTLEGQDFARLHPAFVKAGTTVFGISRDSVASHEKFRDKLRYPFALLSDADEQACRLFDVIREKNMYGRKVLGVERSTFLIDADGVLRREWRKVKVDGHAQEVLEAAQAL